MSKLFSKYVFFLLTLYKLISTENNYKAVNIVYQFIFYSYENGEVWWEFRLKQSFKNVVAVPE